ncbi:MAG: hypothetical protein Ta2D_05730 [Rickettsiales bacterium]|nr:MAG: hypothetical protein Ta2D_05730 [Rickettsiales bacterium]
MNKLLLNIICCFIIKKENRDKFREKYKLSTFEMLLIKHNEELKNEINELKNEITNVKNNVNNQSNELKNEIMVVKNNANNQSNELKNKIMDIKNNADYTKNIEPYIYDNPNDKQIYPNIKILVAYHKPAQLFQHKILLPIHLGRKVAKETATTRAGTFTNNDVAVKWFHDNMIGDDTGDNISDLNRHYNEMTGIYWAWKNYDKIGNPDYIGSYHYRRLFPFEVISDVVNYDMIMRTPDMEWKQMMDWTNWAKHFAKFYPKDEQDFFNNCAVYGANMFIMKKDMFFEYCEWLFPILFQSKFLEGYRRGGGYWSEHLTSYFLWKKTQDKNVKWKEVEMITIS